MYRKHFGFTRHPFDKEIAVEDLFPSASAAEIDVRLGHLLEVRPQRRHGGKPLPLLMLLDDLQIVQTNQGRHRLVAPGNNESFMTMGAFGNEFGKMTFGIGNGYLRHDATPVKKGYSETR